MPAGESREQGNGEEAEDASEDAEGGEEDFFLEILRQRQDVQWILAHVQRAGVGCQVVTAVLDLPGAVDTEAVEAHSDGECRGRCHLGLQNLCQVFIDEQA